MNSKYIIVLFIFSSCISSTKRKTNTDQEFYENGTLKYESKVLEGKKEGITINYFENGGIKSIRNYVGGLIDGESVWFSENGTVQEKSTFSKGLQEGFAYYFYPSGVIKGYRVWKKNKEVGYVSDYWDGTGEIKALIYFNDSGIVIYKKYFDSLGHLIKEEGVHP
jgi:antitoxin component YwqK of YwqJK toxin-antitoxin module